MKKYHVLTWLIVGLDMSIAPSACIRYRSSIDVEAGDEMQKSTAKDEKFKLNTEDEMQKNTARDEK